MTDLITRLSKLDAPDREVDAQIWLIELQSAESDPFGGYGLAEDWRYEYEAACADGTVANPAIALLIALLRAKEAERD